VLAHLQVADTLQFLHAEANLVHCALCPEAIFLTGGGAWKLASASDRNPVMAPRARSLRVCCSACAMTGEQQFCQVCTT